MKATLEFDLAEDGCQHIIALHAMDFALSCWDINQKLRGWLKHGHQFDSADEALEGVREKLGEIMDVYNINLNMIE